MTFTGSSSQPFSLYLCIMTECFFSQLFSLVVELRAFVRRAIARDGAARLFTKVDQGALPIQPKLCGSR